ncbi:MAG TPA: hypothetical protein VMB79_18610 [Jatrophihabitans sp.]|nr:hypothetical protein [Jatrophihabitans sp.]
MTTTQIHKTAWATERLAGRRADVRLAGSGIAVDLLAAILARGGLQVTVAGGAGQTGPAGVNTVPYTAELFYLLADRFRVPEIADLAMFGRLPAALQATSGVKQSLGFPYHRARSAHDHQENVQFTVPGEHAEWHAYLPDVQLRTRAIAERYGARYTDEGGAVLELDCTGGGRPGGLHATALFTGLVPFEQLRPSRDGGYTLPWSEGSTAHAVRGGWLHLTPFGNHPGGTNPGVAVTLRLAGGPADADPDEVLARLAAQYPDLGLQLRGAVRTGPWVSSATGPPDDRQLLPGEGALALDLGHGEALFGQNLTLALELVHAAGALLLRPGALAGSEAAASTARALADFQRELLTENAWFAGAVLAATGNFATWNAAVRVWLLWSISSALALKKVRIDSARSGNWAAASKFDRGVGWFDLAPGIAGVVSRSARELATTAEVGVSPAAVAARVFRLLSQRRIIPPLYKFGDPAARRYQLNLPTRLKLMAWVFTIAPKEYKGMLTADNITAVPDAEAELKR